MDPSKTISPKIIATGVVYLVGAFVLAAAAALTPELFSFAGPWGVVIYAGIVGAVAQIAGWLKTDPLRQAAKHVYKDGEGTFE
jgi:hypothetical protein